jgi:fluoride exporter
MGMGWTGLWLVAVGGALGGMGRLAVSNLVARQLGTRFPWGTLAVNLSGALAAGWLAGHLGLPTDRDASPAWLGLVIGVLGGYTTVSSFSLQTLALWHSGRLHRALFNVLATCVAGLLMAALGWWLAGGGG